MSVLGRSVAKYSFSFKNTYKKDNKEYLLNNVLLIGILYYILMYGYVNRLTGPAREPIARTGFRYMD